MTVWVVRFGNLALTFYTDYHAEQEQRALELNGTPCTVTVEKR